MRGRVAAAAALALLVALPAPAQAAKPRLALSSFAVPDGPALDPDRTFVLRVRVANRARRARRVVLSFSLRTTPRRRRANAYPVGAVNTFRLRARRARRVRVRAQLPRAFPLRAGRPYWVTACVRRRRARRTVCRTAPSAIVFRARRRPAAP
ncbi:MAG TPA: hypothetical protein VHF89_08620, partial [Solirubrobacteraceae bacterium]|nr:hypothetical protein [Solirubrobacteraceae bacterium]